MKKRNIAAAILLASMMAVSTCAVTSMTAVAATHTLTIKQAANDAATHSYTAYPIMTGTLATDGQTLTGLAWAAGVDADKFVAALKAFDSTTFSSLPSTGATADQVAAKLKGYTNVEGLAKVFNATGSYAFLGTGTSLTKSGTTYSASGLEDGWYVVIDSIDTAAKTPNDTTGTTNVRSANLLQIVGDTTAGPKYSVPTLEKKIVETSGLVDANAVNIGDVVTYQVKVPVPDVTGYNKYFYTIDDTLSAGLTYTEGSLAIKWDNNTPDSTNDDVTLTLDTDGAATGVTGNYYATIGTYNATTGTAMKIVFENCVNYFKAKDGYFYITYTATLNDKAVITDVGNPNTAKLNFSNNPNHNYIGTPTDGGEPEKPDEPGPSDTGVIGETPWNEVKTYTTQIKIKKVDQDGNPLKGATFTLTCANMNKVIVSAGTTFEQDDTNGTYWKLTNGSYTTTDPKDTSLSDAAKAAYSNDGHKYKKSETARASTTATTSGSTKTIEGTVDDSGILTFTGLAAGSYTLEETGVPDGYNKAPNVSFTLNANPTLTRAGWTTVVNDGDTEYYDSTDKMIEVNVKNYQGTTLPSTGGIGTTIFYVVGGTLVAGAVVLLITKKRMSINDQK